MNFRAKNYLNCKAQCDHLFLAPKFKYLEFRTKVIFQFCKMRLFVIFFNTVPYMSQIKNRNFSVVVIPSVEKQTSLNSRKCSCCLLKSLVTLCFSPPQQQQLLSLKHYLTALDAKPLEVTCVQTLQKPSFIILIKQIFISYFLFSANYVVQNRKCYESCQSLQKRISNDKDL